MFRVPTPAQKVRSITYNLISDYAVIYIQKQPQLLQFLDFVTDRGVFGGGGANRRPLNSANTGRVCLKHPNEWHSVTFESYRTAFLAAVVA